MTAVVQAARTLAAELGEAARRLGRTLAIDGVTQLDRGEQVKSHRPPPINRSCRLLASSNGWIAVNLARESDLESAAAWLGLPGPDADWDAIETAVSRQETEALLANARLLGLPVASVGEVADGALNLRGRPFGSGARRPTPIVLDLSALWAGPLCAGLLGEAGMEVVRLENTRRPDPTPISRPALDAKLNGMKSRRAFDYSNLTELRARILAADIVVTSARPRAFQAMGLDPATLIAARPGLIWVAISGYGWLGPDSDRVAFGDDAAAAGGLVDWASGRPRLVGDAVADPLTGMAAALAALKALDTGGGVLIDAAMASVAAGARLQ